MPEFFLIFRYCFFVVEWMNIFCVFFFVYLFQIKKKFSFIFFISNWHLMKKKETKASDDKTKTFVGYYCIFTLFLSFLFYIITFLYLFTIEQLLADFEWLGLNLRNVRINYKIKTTFNIFRWVFASQRIGESHPWSHLWDDMCKIIYAWVISMDDLYHPCEMIYHRWSMLGDPRRITSARSSMGDHLGRDDPNGWQTPFTDPPCSEISHRWSRTYHLTKHAGNACQLT